MKAISVKNINIGNDSIRYIEFKDSTNTFITVEKSSVVMIQYKNGKTDSFSQSTKADTLTEQKRRYKFFGSLFSSPNYDSSSVRRDGPANLFYSLVIPGTGDYKVRPKNKPYWIITILSYGLVGTGIYYGIKSNTMYSHYRSEDFNDNKLFNSANDKHHLSSVLIVSGAGIWLTDVVLVAIKGFKNKRKNKPINVINTTP